jgi:hexosaminidase
MSWRGESGGIAAANAGHDVIMTPGEFLYFDSYQTDPRTQQGNRRIFTFRQSIFL